MKKYNNLIGAAVGKNKADLVLKNAFILNVLDSTIEKNDIAICDDLIVGIGSYEGEKEINCEGLYIAPGFIESHVHIESSMVTPEIYSSISLQNGVTTAIIDPHEIANVKGIDGIRFMIENSKKAKMDLFFNLPSCVPATNFEDNGAILNAEDLSELLKEDNVLGLGEVMDVEAVLGCDEEMLKKLALFESRVIDGHCPLLFGKSLNAYILAGIKTDHECLSSEEAREKVKRGLYVMLREGSAARNLISLLPSVDRYNYKRFLYCTDDRHLEDLVMEGSINNCIKKSIEWGLESMIAYSIGTINAAECYGLKDRGIIAPGFKADLVILEDIKEVKIKNVIKNGQILAKNDDISYNEKETVFSNTINYKPINRKIFEIQKKSDNVNVIKVIKGSLQTEKIVRKVLSKGTTVQEIEGDNILKIAVVERHKNTHKSSVGFIQGISIKNCAVAQSIAHDSHNVIVIGDNDCDMELAVNTILNLSGGIAIISKGKVLDYIRLPICGLMTDDYPERIIKTLKNLKNITKKLGFDEDMDLFTTLSFLSLPVIPDLKITASGLFDFQKYEFIDLFA